MTLRTTPPLCPPNDNPFSISDSSFPMTSISPFPHTTMEVASFSIGRVRYSQREFRWHFRPEDSVWRRKGVKCTPDHARTHLANALAQQRVGKCLLRISHLVSSHGIYANGAERISFQTHPHAKTFLSTVHLHANRRGQTTGGCVPNIIISGFAARSNVRYLHCGEDEKSGA